MKKTDGAVHDKVIFGVEIKEKVEYLQESYPDPLLQMLLMATRLRSPCHLVQH
jgi:hypothetical protein